MYTNIYIWHKRPFVPLPAKSFNSALEEQLALIAFERVNICPPLTPIGRCQVLVYMCVWMYMRIHISLLNCRGAEKMPARPCPIRSVRSGPVRPVCPVRALWAQGTGADRTDRTGPDKAGTARWPSLAWPCPVRSGPSGPLQCLGPRTGRTGPDRMDRTDRTAMEWCSKTSFWTKSDGVLLPSRLLAQKWWRVAPKQAFAPKVMECCSQASFCSKRHGRLLQNKFLIQKLWIVAPKQYFAPKVMEGCSKTI